MHGSWIWTVASVVIIFAAIILVAALKESRGSGKIGMPYERAKALFSAAERSFLGALDQALGPEYRVFGKIRVADLASVTSGLSNAARQSALNRVALKHVDFVVCRASDLSAVCAVELNDASHGSRRAKARDEFLANVCRTIELPLLTITAQRGYLIEDLRQQVLAATVAFQPHATASDKSSIIGR